jgi:Outer membrane protein beta-barrel domain
MKKSIGYIIIFLVGLSPLQAQAPAPRLGVHSFAGLSSLHIFDGLYSDNTVGVFTGGGLSVELPINQRLAFEVGARYTFLRGSYDHPEADDRETVFRHKNSGFSVPVNLNIYFNDNREKAFFQIGFTPMYGIRNEVIVYSVQDGSDYSRNQDITNRYDFRRRDLFGQMGLGYNFPLGQKAILTILPYFSMNVPGGIRNIIQYDNQWFDYPIFNNRQWCLQASLKMTNDK